MISGRQALAIIEQTIASARRAQDRLDAALRAASERAVRLRAERMEMFRKLARSKLEALASDKVAEQLGSAEQRALAVLDRQQQSFKQLTERRQQAQEQMQRAEASRHERAAEVEKAFDVVAELRTRVAAQTRIDPRWAQLRRRIDELAGVVPAAERKLTQAEADREQKRKPYDNDPLFRYLWQRRFGTAEYKPRGMARLPDRWIARMIGYDDARVNYTLLNELPLRLRNHLDRLRQDSDAVAAELKRLERAALDEAGIAQADDRLAKAREALDHADGMLATAGEALSALDREHAAAVSGQAPHGPAIELLATANAAKDLLTLYQQALKTPDPEDERVIAEIQRLEGAIGEAEGEIGKIRQEIRDLAARRGEIEQERDEFRRRGYDRPGGIFGNETLLANVLGGVLKGTLQRKVLREAVDQGYRRDSAKASDFGGPWG
jgi:chromosome segregation ATPase